MLSYSTNQEQQAKLGTEFNAINWRDEELTWDL